MKIQCTADDTKKGMTVAELRRFLGMCDHYDLPDTARLKVQVRMTGALKSIAADAPANGQGDA